MRFSTFKWLQRILVEVDPLLLQDISDYGYEATLLAEEYDKGHEITYDLLEGMFGPRNGSIEAVIDRIYPYRQLVF